MSEEILSSEEKRCPACGATIPEEAPRGLCPKCVLAGAATADEAETVLMGSGGVEPPSIERVAAAFPHLEILELIGWGGMGAVYKARQPHLDRLVALKILDERCAELPAFQERFTREGQVLAKMSHPNIVGIHDFGESGGFYFLLMEYVDGVNLRQAMRAGRFTPKQALAVVPKVCEALQFAHDEGILHRDIKPENILLDSRGDVKIVDFGIAKMLDSGGRGVGMTLTGTSAPGTPHYMAPEQIEKPGEVDHRADIYSLGVVIYEMLTGELPLGRFAPPSEKVAVDARIDEIVFRTLEKERSMRQQSVTEVRTQVEAVRSGEGESGEEREQVEDVRPKAVGDGRVAVRRAGRSSVLLSLGFLLLILCGVAAFIASMGEYKEAKAGMRWRSDLTQLKHQVRSMEMTTESAERNQLPPPKIAELREELDVLSGEHDRLEQDGPPNLMKDDYFWQITFPTGAAVVLGVAGLLLLIRATVMGWEALRRLRESGVRRGRLAAGTVALLLPVVLLDALIFLVMVAPVRGDWEGPAISLSVILVVAVDIWIFKTLARWLSEGPAAGADDGLDDLDSGSKGRGWLMAVLAVVLIGAGVAVSMGVGRSPLVLVLIFAVMLVLLMGSPVRGWGWINVTLMLVLTVGLFLIAIFRMKEREMLNERLMKHTSSHSKPFMEEKLKVKEDIPGDLFVVAFMAQKAGERMMKAGRIREARDEFQSAKWNLENLARRFPKWESGVVGNRLEQVRELIDETGGEVEVEEGDGTREGTGGAIRPLEGEKYEADAFAMEVTVRPGFELEIVPVLEEGRKVTVCTDLTWRKFGIGEPDSTRLDVRFGADGDGLEIYDGKRSEWGRWANPEVAQWEVGRLDGEILFGGDGFALGEYHEIVAFSGRGGSTGARHRIRLRMRMREFEGGKRAPGADTEEPGESSGEIDLVSIQPVHDENEPGTFVGDVFVREGFEVEMVAELETGSGKRFESKALGWKKAAMGGPVRARLKWRPGGDEPDGIEFLEGGLSHENWWEEAKGVEWKRVQIEDLKRCRNNGWEVGKEERMLLLWGKRDGDEGVFRFSLKMTLRPIYTDG